MGIGDVITLDGHVGVIVAQSDTWSDVLWDKKFMQHSGGPPDKLGNPFPPPGTYRITEPEAWPTSFLTPAKCLCCFVAGRGSATTSATAIPLGGVAQ